MIDITTESVAEEMYAHLAEAAGKRNVSVNDLIKEMQAKLGAGLSRDECKKAVRLLIDSQRCVYCFLSGVNYIQVAPPK